MEENKKRLYFTADEKVYVKELAIKYRDVVESKKSDVVSISMKKKKWQEITDEFNLNSQYTKRTAEQIKKCWENMKTKRKQELAQEKRQRMTTGGGPYPGSSRSTDPNIDGIDTIDIEVQDANDSDTLALVANKCNSGAYVLLSDGSLGMDEEQSQADVQEEFENSAQIRDQDKTTPGATREARKSATGIIKESDKRLERCDALLLQDKELHSLRMKEMAAKVMVADMACQKMALEMQHMKEKHELEKKMLMKNLSH